jgi:ribose 5-phosphate isomerase B
LRKISISSDHAGFELKESIKKFLIKKKFLVLDLGPRDDRSVDYPDYAKKLAKNIISKKSDTGILVCGSGIGMAMSANRFKKIRAAVCYNVKSTKLSRSHNNANVIAIGSRLTKEKLALKLVMIFLKTKFDGGRHKRRTNKI